MSKGSGEWIVFMMYVRVSGENGVFGEFSDVNGIHGESCRVILPLGEGGSGKEKGLKKIKLS